MMKDIEKCVGEKLRSRNFGDRNHGNPCVLRSDTRKAQAAFSLLELMTALIIVAILAALIIQSGSYMIERAQRTSCTNNLKSLFAATSSYMMDYQMWPQVSTADITGTSYAQGWIDALTPYQIGKVNWICPSVQRLLNNPDYIQPQDVRVDYFATPFDTNAASPGRYGTQPWFAERANVHGDGNLMIFASGTVKSLNQAVADSISQPPPAAQ